MTLHEKFEAEVENTLNVFARIKRARAEPYFADSVMRRLAEKQRKPTVFVSRSYRMAFAALFVLIVVNVFSLIEIRSHSSSKESTDPVQGIATEYQLSVTGYAY